MVPQTNDGRLAELKPHTRIPDSKIQPKNIILGSPKYIPYKRPKSLGKGKGGKGPKLKNMVNNVEMVRTKQTPKLDEMTSEKKTYNEKARYLWTKLWAKRLARANTKDHKTSSGKAPCKQLATKVVAMPQYQQSIVEIGQFMSFMKLSTFNIALTC